MWLSTVSSSLVILACARVLRVLACKYRYVCLTINNPQGTKDIPYGTTVPTEHIKLFTSAPKAELTFVPDGGHYLNATNPAEVADAMLKMITA